MPRRLGRPGFVAGQQCGHCQQVVAVDQPVAPRWRGIAQRWLHLAKQAALHRRQRIQPGIGADPVADFGILGRQHPFAGLQPYAVAAFEAFDDFFGLLSPFGDDFRELFEQGFGHGMKSTRPSGAPLQLTKPKVYTLT